MKNGHTKNCPVTSVIVAIATTVLSTAAFAQGPTVSGNVISWTEPGWHQVQVQSSGKSLCEGGRQCTVPEGVYKVINHGTGERFEFIPVTANTTNTGIVPAPVASTGQTTSFAFGDDGDFQSGVVVAGVRFHDNNDGTFTDMLTGIIWLSRPDCMVKRDWSGAVDYANNLSAGGDMCPNLDDGSVAGDWRLPTIKELYSLGDMSRNSPAFARGIPYTGPTWTEYPWDHYWSSTSFTPATQTNAWSLNADFANPTIRAKSEVEWVWAIRVGE